MLYKNLSKYYQDLILDKEYDGWTDYMLSVVKNNLNYGVGYDVGCGTGIFTRKLKRAGYNVVGVDISPEMLSVAKEVSTKENLNVDYRLADMRSIKSFEKLDFITVVNDGVNYLTQKDLSKTFLTFSKCLKKGGILLFDISTEYKLSNVLNGNMFGSDDEELSYIWLSEYDKNSSSLSINLSFFEKVGNLYKRRDEQQTQYAHNLNDVEVALKNANFEVVFITNAYGEKVLDITERAVFLAKKL